MAEWTIYGKDGVAKASVKELELHDEWMAECFITVSVKSAEPIDFAVGDYIDYRNERYSINYDPSKIKKARSGTYGEGFTYDNIKFVAVQDELVRCDFCDIVLSDNQIHYTQLSTFPFYCETVDDLLDRIQANMEDLYPGAWIIISPDLNRDRQRGLCVDREQAFIDAYNKYIGGGEFTYEKTGVALTVDNINCWDALAKVNTDFALNFIVRDRIVIVGTAGVFTPKKFRYGKGNGLYELEAIGDSEQKVVTRLRAYGSEQNLPDRYYAERNLRVFSTVTEIESKYGTDSYTGIAFFTDLIFSAKYFTYRSQSYPGTSDRPNYIVRMSAHGHEVTGYVSTDYSSDKFYIYSEYKGDIPDDRDEENREEMEAFTRDLEVGDKVYFTAYVEKGAFDAEHQEASETSLPDNMAVNKLMLPGFPDMSLDEWVRANRPELIEEGFEFSTNPVRPYIDSPNKERYGIRPSNIFFDGTGDTDDIHPTLEGMTWDGHPCDEVVEAQQIEDNGVLSDNSKEADKRVTITIPYAGFKLNEEWVDGATISMKDGMCGARDFKILKKPTQDNNGNWICVCERAYDSVLKMYFPYSDFQIHTGDKFVLTGIDLPDSYIEAASVKLFDAAMDALRKNHLSRVTYQPKIDHIWMARQHDMAMASGGAIESLHDTLKAGDYFSFADEDLGIDASIIIDILTIKEHADSGLATYEITLRDEKVVSALEKRLEKIVSDASGNGGSYSMRQTGSLVEQIGSELFLSKIEDDDAAGAIGFMKGIWFGIKDWFIDNTGSANLFDATINGLLKAYNAVINKVKSANFTGYGMLDTGWNIENDYEGTDSYAVFDRLYIRKKAIFEELELRKISHIGGNFCLSPASGRAYQVEYYDGEGNQLGVEEKTVPWVLGYKVLMLFSRSMANKYLGKRKMIERPLTEAERQLVKRVRVYLFSDDGTTKTMSNWTVGAQARCQTFNIESQMDYHGSGEDSDNPDVSYWTGKKVQNTYWWRLVSAVGEGTLRDGKKHSYIEFLCNTDNEYVVADTGSDLPAVGDEFGQFGHRTDTSQQNVIMIETANPDSPSMKFYRGVNSWSLEGKRKTILSPMGTEIYSQRYHIETAYDDVIVPMDRGEWVSGTEYFYYDRVSHGGSLWLCIIPEGSSTTDEPSESSVVWQKQVAKGDKGETSFKSLVFKRSATKPSKPTGGSYASPVPSGWSDGIPSGTDTIWMSSRIFSTDGKSPQQSAWTAVQLMSDTESFDVEFSPVASNPGNPTDNPDNWYDPTTDPSADWENMIWMATRTKNNGVWGNWEITKVKGEKGSFKSRVFKRTNSDISGTRPTGGTYDSPIPTSGGWTDGIPSGDAILWSSVRTFDIGGGTTEWSLPVKETDTATLDIEFSPNATCPAVPYGTDASQKDSTTYINKRTAQGWHDPSRLPTGTMIWRAECKIKNGVYELGADSKPAWVMTRIYGEKGDAGTNAITTALKYTGPLADSATKPTVATYKNFTWVDNIPTQTEAKPNVYVGVWKYDASKTLDINTTAPTSVSLFAHYGKTGAAGTDGTDGKNGTSILAAPNAIIINQQRTSSGAESLSNINYPIVVVARDSGTIVKATISSLTATRCTASITKNNATDATVTITAIKKYTESGKTKYYTSGSVAFNVTATTAAGNAFTASISVPFGCNLLGQYTIDIEEDVKTEVSSKVTAEIDERNLVNTTDMNTAITQSAKGLTTEINKVNNRLNEGGDIATSISNTNSRVSTAEGNIQTISVDMLDVLDVAKWEQGTTTGETANKTYDAIKTTSTTRIRTKTLIPITAGTTVILNNTTYQVGFVFFNSSKKTTVVTDTTSAWRGWISGSSSAISIDKPSAAAYVALVIRKSDDSTIAATIIRALKLSLSDNSTYTKTETANLVSQSVSDKVTTTTFEQTVNSINTTVAGKVSTSTFNQTVNSINTAVEGKVSTSTFNQTVNNINASVTSVSEDAKTVIDVSKWENGTTDNETAGKTYDQIKYDNNTRIRTKVLIPITGTTVVSMPRTTYSIDIILFDSSKKTVNWTGTSSATSGWIQGSSNVISVHGATKAAYMAILIKKNTEAAISPSEITDANLYVTDKAYLSKTGIDITTGKIKLRADKVTFENSAGTVSNKISIDATTGTLHAVDGEFSGKITATSGSINGNITIGTVGNKMQIYTDETVGTYKKSGIRGVNDNTTLLDLGFSDNNYPMLLLRAQSWTGSPITTHYPGFTSFSYGNYFAEFGMNSLGQVRIYAPKAAWPSRNQVGVGSLYVGEDEVLRVRLS